MVTVDERTFQVAPGVRLRARIRQAGPGPIHLLVHGLASNARLWDGVGDALAERGLPSVAVDLRGHGRSDRPTSGYDFTTITDDLVAVVAALGDDPVVAVGQSWGGNVVVELAARYPHLVRSLVCVDGGFIALRESFPDWPTAARELAPPCWEGLSRERLEREMRRRFAGWPAAAIDAQLANFEVGGEGEVRARLARSAQMEILRELWEHHPDRAAASVGVPTLVIVASHESPGDRRRVMTFASHLQRGTVVEVDGHHDLHAQQPEVVAELISRVEAG